ncbi:MAG: ubiquinone biosynthesis accessory factor UbiJ [Gammaproteobacteria bacterium]
MIVKPLFMEAAETVLNRYLSMDEDAGHFLKPLVGKVIAVRVMPFGWTFYLCPSQDNIQILEQCSETPDTILTGSASALGMMGLSSSPMRSVFSGEVTIEGDMDTGRKFQAFLARLDPDFEEALSRFTGDVVAHRLFRWARAGRQWGEDAVETLGLNVKEFLQDETRDLPAEPEIEIFFREVDRLRVDCDRIVARCERLEKSIDHSQSGGDSETD